MRWSQALNDYTGAVLIISHDRHLIEATVDKLWIAQNGTIEEFDEDLDSYQRMLTSGKDKPQKGAAAALPRRSTRRPQRQDSAARRAEVAPLRKSIKDAEQKLGRLRTELGKVEAILADPKIYDGAPERVILLGKDKARFAAEIAKIEERWLALSEELEAGRARMSSIAAGTGAGRRISALPHSRPARLGALAVVIYPAVADLRRPLSGTARFRHRIARQRHSRRLDLSDDLRLRSHSPALAQPAQSTLAGLCGPPLRPADRSIIAATALVFVLMALELTPTRDGARGHRRARLVRYVCAVRARPASMPSASRSAWTYTWPVTPQLQSLPVDDACRTLGLLGTFCPLAE